MNDLAGLSFGACSYTPNDTQQMPGLPEFVPPAKADRADVAGLVELLSRAAPATCGKVGAPR
ncbi:hypothetical protein [Mesorhizobium loti]|uniref:hypothetical protein n=1 Tax=Rhizobium loti TaxID=381 RepID=UPI0011B47878|nr:hypothetical protein [Mesorhizobium loti]